MLTAALVAVACTAPDEEAVPTAPSVTVQILGTSTTVAVRTPPASIVPLPEFAPRRRPPIEFPTPDTTGLIDPGALEFHEGDYVVTEDGAVVENLEINGTLEVRGARDVLIRNVHVYTSGFWTVYTTQGGSLTIEDSEIGHPDHIGQRGLGGHEVTARRVDIHHVEDAIKVGNQSTYDWVICRDLASLADDPHYDCVQDDGGASDAIFTRVSLDPTPVPGYERGDRSNGNAAWFIKSDLGPIDNVTIMDSYIEGGGFSIFAQAGGEYPAPTNVRVINNRFGRGHVWGLLYEQPFIVWYDNVWDDSGEPVYRDGAPVPDEVVFADVAGDEASSVAWLYWAGIADGCGASAFCPGETITRATMATWLTNAVPLLGGETDVFSDDTDLDQAALNRLAEAGMVDACDVARFCGDEALTVAQAAWWLAAVLDVGSGDVDYFADDDGHAAESAINGLAGAGILVGCDDGLVCPDAPLTRGQAAVLLRRMLD